MVRREILPWCVLAAAIVVGVYTIIGPAFPAHVPGFARFELMAQVGAVAATLNTWRLTGALPISSHEIHAGVEYPYILLGNMALYLIAAFLSGVLALPPYLGMALALALGFAVAAGSVYLLATRAGVHRYLAVALGFLYAAGPYLCVDLFVRSSFPEYLAWQVTPALLLIVRRSVRPQAGPLALLAGALAFAAPFYFHKLVAPHVALTLVLLSVNTLAWRFSSVARLALVGILALLFSVPAWSPAVRGLGADTVRGLGGDVVPSILNASLTNLLWPYAQDSLPTGPSYDFYEGRFALQAGLVPVVGFVLAAVMLLTQPRLAWARRLPLPMVLFVVNVVLILGWFRAWEFAPAPLRYVQFSYRLLGLVHLLGFLLLIQVLGSPCALLRRAPLLGQRLVTLAFVVLAGASVSTYWHRPPLTDIASADIRPSDLGTLDACAFCRPTPQSNLTTQTAIRRDRTLVAPPRLVLIPPEEQRPSVILIGEVSPLLFEGTSQDVVVSIYGFVKTELTATPDHLTNVILSTAGTEQTVAPIMSLVDAARRAPASPASTTPAAPSGFGPDVAALPSIPWGARLLAETTVTQPGPFRLEAPLDPSIAAVAVECSRAVLPRPGVPEAVCISVDALASPNHGPELVVPREIPAANLTWRPLGGASIDARALPLGPYLLPTYDYGFVRVVDATGAPVRTAHFDRRPVLWHDGRSPMYSVSYDFSPEGLAVASGLLIFLVAVLVMRVGSARRDRSAEGSTEPTPRAAGRARKPSVAGESS